MKKIIGVLVCSLIFSISFAQVQRQKKTVDKSDSSLNTTAQKQDAGMNKREMMKDLDLTKEQKGKLKEIRQAGKAQKEAIENDEKLSADEKQAKLKGLKKEQAKSTMSILSREQKLKLLKMRQEKKGGMMDEMDNE
ncbi:hypothetical protein [Ferruginibacter sp. SUN106]|uniref:hypothetical protein n=1 Tax=Ferruginibacter sp. SUN106 TaxID=2978348 RepID=UPI003D36FF89